MNFSQLRQRAGFRTQADLAAAIKRDQTTISQIETGKVRDLRYSTMRALAKALKVSTDAIAKAIDETEAVAP